MKLFRLTLLFLFIYTLGHLAFLSRGGFSLKRIFASPWEGYVEGEREKEILPKLQQPYYYLGRGRQCYAFVSEDGSLVLKLPRFDLSHLPLLSKVFNISLSHDLKARQKRMNFVLNSFLLAENHFPDESGLIYSHLYRTKTLPKKFVFYDRMKRPFKIDLNETIFAIQERHPLLFPSFLRELKHGNREKAQKMLLDFLDLLKIRAEKGLFNKDAGFLKNFSWRDGKCFQIDIGSLYQDPLISKEQTPLRSFHQGAWPVHEWLLPIDPELASLIKTRVDDMQKSCLENQKKCSSLE